MKKEQIIESLKHSFTPNDEEREIISKLLEMKSDKGMFISSLFNYGKQQGIRKERSRKSKSKSEVV